MLLFLFSLHLVHFLFCASWQVLFCWNKLFASISFMLLLQKHRQQHSFKIMLLNRLHWSKANVSKGLTIETVSILNFILLGRLTDATAAPKASTWYMLLKLTKIWWICANTARKANFCSQLENYSELGTWLDQYGRMVPVLKNTDYWLNYTIWFYLRIEQGQYT